MSLRRFFFIMFRAILAALLATGTAASAAPEIDVKVEKRDDTFYIDTAFEVQASAGIVWQVLTDFEHMADVQPNLRSSKILERKGNTLRIRQEGLARFGVFSYAFVSEREIRLEPKKRILARQTAGNTQRFASEMEISPSGNGARLRYHAEMALDSTLGKLFGRSFIEHEIAEQFTAIAAEMEKRERTNP